MYMEYEYGMQQEKRNVPYITIALIVINVAVFLTLEFLNSTENIEFMYRMGAMFAPDVFERGKWYQLFSSMFLHYGYDHLSNNMIMLAILGYQIEEKYGRFKYLMTYIICGLAGNIISGKIEMISGNYAVSVGASGAVFGIFGVLLVMVFKSRKQLGQISPARLMLLFAVVVFGNMQDGIDWVAHLGGGLTGLAMAFVLYRPDGSDELLNL